MKSIDVWAEELHAIAKEKGFWDERSDVHFILSKIALIHSEASEILEAVRKDMGPKAVTEEIADLVIRTLDLYQAMVEGGYLVDGLEETIERKTAINKERPHRHGVLA